MDLGKEKEIEIKEEYRNKGGGNKAVSIQRGRERNRGKQSKKIEGRNRGKGKQRGIEQETELGE